MALFVAFMEHASLLQLKLPLRNLASRHPLFLSIPGRVEMEVKLFMDLILWFKLDVLSPD